MKAACQESGREGFACGRIDDECGRRKVKGLDGMSRPFKLSALS